MTLVHLDRLLAERFGKPVQLVTEGALSLYIKDRVMNQLRTVYEK